ncbi:chromosomal replication initiator protein DnaA [Bacteroidia bacterium]|nr:chromosomal replication initiator protein DnaA [Bacteroidia bacterium]
MGAPLTYSEIWQDCLSLIKTKTSEEEFNKWFQPIVPLDFNGTTLQLKVPNESYVYHIEKNCLNLLRPIICDRFGLNIRLRYIIPQSDAAKGPSSQDGDTSAIRRIVAQSDGANIENPFVIPGIRKLIIDPQLNPKYTLETFVEGDCNRLARSAGKAVAIDPGKTAFNPLYIFGDSGLGKTHLAHAIGMEARQRHPDMRVLYVAMNKFQAQFTSATLRHEINDFINFYQMIDLLIIDDIQELAGKEKTQNAFFNIFNHLQLSGKQLIITSDKPPVELSDINQRLLTRFAWGLSAPLSQPDLETKIKIIRNKASRLGADLSEEVIIFLAESIRANVREIEGALSSLIANATFLGKKITISLAKEVLKIYVQVHRKEITIDSIKQIVCQEMNVDVAAFHSPKRTREIAQARQVAMYLSKQHTKSPLTAIGAAIGDKNHATVLHACKAISNLMETDRVFRAQVEEIERKVLAQ